MPVKLIVMHNPEFDEPADAIIYMVAAAMGFAAIENVLALFQAIPDGAQAALQIWLLRFIGATLLHAVSSAIVGYFLALSWFNGRHSQKLIPAGLALASLTHFVFNIILLKGGGGSEGFIYSTALLVVMAFAVSVLFAKIKKRPIGFLNPAASSTGQ